MEKIVTINGTEITIGHYKEPLRAIPLGLGYGYYGVLLQTSDSEGVMCHICGKDILLMN